MSDSLCYSCRLKERCNGSKTRLHTLLYSRRIYSEKVDEFFVLQLKLSLLRQAIRDERNKTQEMNNELSKLVKSNNRRNEWLKKVKRKDYQSKYKMAEVECNRKKANLNQELTALQKTRQTLIKTITGEIFHLKTPPPSVTTATTHTRESSDNMATNLCLEDIAPIEFEIIDTTNELTPSSPLRIQEYPLSSIGHGVMPNSEQLVDYLQPNYYHQSVMVSNNTVHSCDVDDPSADVTNHLSDPSKGVSASLSMIVHLVTVLSNILNQSLPHPVVLPIALSEFGRAKGKSLQELNRFVAKQDDNIVYLCFTQAVDCNELVMGDTIGNLLKLLTSDTLGRTGPFSCYPALLRYPRTKTKRSSSRALSIDPVSGWDCEPPLLHTAHLSPAGTGTGPDVSIDSGHHYHADEEYEEHGGSYLSSDEDDSIRGNNNIGKGWEEVNEMIVPSTNSYYGLSPPSTISKERLEYGVSYSDYTLNYGRKTHVIDDSQENQTSGSLMGTIGNLLGSGWIKKQ